MADSPSNQPHVDDAAILSLLERLESSERRDIDERETECLIASLGHSSRTLRRRTAAVLAAAMQRHAVPPELCEAELDSSDPDRRWAAAFALARAGRTTPRVVDVALEQFGSRDGDVRWAAASIVTSVACVIEALRTELRELTESPDATRRKMALLCLAECGDRDTNPAMRALADVDVYVRMAALKALGRVGGSLPEVLDAVRSIAAGDTDPRVRRAATAISGRLEAAASEGVATEIPPGDSSVRKE